MACPRQQKTKQEMKGVLWFSSGRIFSTAAKLARIRKGTVQQGNREARSIFLKKIITEKHMLGESERKKVTITLLIKKI